MTSGTTFLTGKNSLPNVGGYVDYVGCQQDGFNINVSGDSISVPNGGENPWHFGGSYNVTIVSNEWCSQGINTVPAPYKEPALLPGIITLPLTLNGSREVALEE